MKRDRFTSEYDRIREEAGYSRLHVKTEFPESTIDENGRTVEDRVEMMRLDVHEKMNLANLSEQEKVKREQSRRRHEAFRAKIDRQIMLDEYAALGIEPPEPLHSLKFMLFVGWRVDNLGGKNVLTRAGPEQPRRRVERSSAPNDDIPF